jgi:iron complex outermembrane receptor protein
MPGVTAEYVNGQAEYINIRGFSQNLSSTLLNGREQASTGDSRAVQFDRYPSELMGAVNVYKTPDATLVDQGLAGTIDLQTVSPLNFPSRTISVNARKERDGMQPGAAGTGNRESFSYIDQFFDRKLGIALGFARSKDTGPAVTNVNSWGSGTTTYDGQTVNVPDNGIGFQTSYDTYKRDGEMAVIEFRPNKDIHSQIDMFHSTNKERLIQDELQFPLNDSYQSATNVYDLPGVLTNATLSGNNVTAGTWTNVRGDINLEPYATDDTMTSIGWRTSFRVSPDLRATVDLSHSKATQVINDQQIYLSTVGTAGQPGVLGTLSFNNGSYTSSINYADPSIIKIVDPEGWGGSSPQAGYDKVLTNTDKIDTVRLGGSYMLPDNKFLRDVDFGVNFNKRTKTHESDEYLVQVPGSPLAAMSIPGAVGTLNSVGGSGMNIVTFDDSSVVPGLFYNAKLNSNIYYKDWDNEEKITTGMARANIDSQIGSIPVTGNVGLQVVHANQLANALAVSTLPGTDSANPPTQAISAGTSYNTVLPSLNLIGDIGNDQKLRLGVAKEMMRPIMEDMAATTQFGVGVVNGTSQYTGSRGNPYLKPWLADSLDLSYEKYFGKKGYIQIAGFTKYLSSYIVNLPELYDFTPLLPAGSNAAPSNIGSMSQPVNGNGGHVSGIEMTANLPASMLWKPLEGFGFIVSGSDTVSQIRLPGLPGLPAGIESALPGLSKYVGSFTLYYENAGFSARVEQLYRSDFIGTYIATDSTDQYTMDRETRHLSAQVSYEIQSGPAKGLQFMLQGINLRNSPEITYSGVPSNQLTSPRYGNKVYFGINYKM